MCCRCWGWCYEVRCRVVHCVMVQCSLVWYRLLWLHEVPIFFNTVSLFPFLPTYLYSLSLRDCLFSFISYSSYLSFTLIPSPSFQSSLIQLDGGVYSLAMLAALNCGKYNHHPIICWLYSRHDVSCWMMIAAVCGSMDMLVVRSALWLGMRAFKYGVPTSLKMMFFSVAICAMVCLK